MQVNANNTLTGGNTTLAAAIGYQNHTKIVLPSSHLASLRLIIHYSSLTCTTYVYRMNIETQAQFFTCLLQDACHDTGDHAKQLIGTTSGHITATGDRLTSTLNALMAIAPARALLGSRRVHRKFS